MRTRSRVQACQALDRSGGGGRRTTTTLAPFDPFVPGCTSGVPLCWQQSRYIAFHTSDAHLCCMIATLPPLNRHCNRIPKETHTPPEQTLFSLSCPPGIPVPDITCGGQVLQPQQLVPCVLEEEGHERGCHLQLQGAGPLVTSEAQLPEALNPHTHKAWGVADSQRELEHKRTHLQRSRWGLSGGCSEE